MKIDLDTRYTDRNGTHLAVCVPWDDVADLIGHDHTGSPVDDDDLTAALIARGAPAWIATTPWGGVADKDAWYVLGDIVDDE